MDLKLFTLVIKAQEPKDPDGDFHYLWIGFSKDQEEAFGRAILEVGSIDEMSHITKWQTMAYKSIRIDNLKSMIERMEKKYKPIKIPVNSPIPTSIPVKEIKKKPDKKNILMLEIIKKKSKYLLNKHKSSFNKKEIEYLKDRLSKRKK